MYNISLINGDGVGPEISRSAIRILENIHDKFNLKFIIDELEAGDNMLSKTGHALPTKTLKSINRSIACLKAPIGESASDVIVFLRQKLNLYANIRPIKSYPNMKSLKNNIDFVIVRENTEDLYLGNEFEVGDTAIAMRVISEKASREISEYACKIAKYRNGLNKVTCVHKANVLKKTDGLFVNICKEVIKSHRNIKFESMYVDACAMNMIRNPEKFDVIVTTNMFGDILSDEAAQISGSLGIVPSANIGEKYALFEPVHGAAFDIAGKQIANPTAIILSIKMMLDWISTKYHDKESNFVATRLENAVDSTIKNNIKTKDIGGNYTTNEFTSEIINRI